MAMPALAPVESPPLALLVFDAPAPDAVCSVPSGAVVVAALEARDRCDVAGSLVAVGSAVVEREGASVMESEGSEVCEAAAACDLEEAAAACD